MTRCESVYQNRNAAGDSLGPARRCTKAAGHPLGDAWHEKHQWMRPGRRVMWPDSAAEGASS